MATTPVALDLIKLDGNSQSRVETNKDCIAEYAEAWKSGVTFPPVDLFTDGNGYHVGDGIHRILGAQRADRSSIPAIVHKGGSHEAAVFSAGANKGHGLRRTNEDKRKCVKMMLELEPDWSDRKIAEHVGVSPTTVGEARKQVSNLDTCAKRVGKDGKKQAAKKKETGGGKTPTGTPKSGGDATDAPAGANPVSIPEDSAGQPIPKALREVFDRSKEFDAHARTLTAIQQWAEKIGAELPGKWLHVQSFKADLNNAKQALRHNKPYAVCPYCQAKKPKCEACKGVGFVSKRIYDGAPQELRA